MRLLSNFFSQPALTLAPQLLGKTLCRNVNGQTLRARVVETEAYCGQADTACHAHKGMTPRNKVMYEKGGTAYVYLCYGIHYLFNIVAANEGEPEAVLIRGVDCAVGAAAIGPGRVTKALFIDKSLNGLDLSVSEELWLEETSEPAENLKYITAPRVGISYASDADKAALWRFMYEGNTAARGKRERIR